MEEIIFLPASPGVMAVEYIPSDRNTQIDLADYGSIIENLTELRLQEPLSNDSQSVFRSPERINLILKDNSELTVSKTTYDPMDIAKCIQTLNIVSRNLKKKGDKNGVRIRYRKMIPVSFPSESNLKMYRNYAERIIGKMLGENVNSKAHYESPARVTYFVAV